MIDGKRETELSRYIATEKLINIINPKGVGDPLVRLQDIMRAIAMTPTANVAPVVYAHWIPKKEMNRSPEAKNYNCSVCGKESFAYPNCPFCGAKMNEEMNNKKS